MSMTICAKCKHMQHVPPRNNIWYSFKCSKVVNTYAHIDPVTGIHEPTEYAFCRDVNTNGNCMYYEEMSLLRKASLLMGRK